MRRLLCLIAILMANVLTVPLVTAQVATPEATPATQSGACETGTPEENIAVAEAYLGVWNSQDVSVFDEVAHPDVIHHWGQGEDTVGTEALKASTKAFFTAFPDLVMTLDLVLADDDYVVIRWTITGTHTGPFFELEPTGAEATWSGINIYRIECGQVVRSWSETDAVGLRAQLQASDDVATPAS